MILGTDFPTLPSRRTKEQAVGSISYTREGSKIRTGLHGSTRGQQTHRTGMNPKQGSKPEGRITYIRSHVLLIYYCEIEIDKLNNLPMVVRQSQDAESRCKTKQTPDPELSTTLNIPSTL